MCAKFCFGARELFIIIIIDLKAKILLLFFVIVAYKRTYSANHTIDTNDSILNVIKTSSLIFLSHTLHLHTKLKFMLGDMNHK